MHAQTTTRTLGPVDKDTELVGELTPSAAVLRAGLAMSELDMNHLWVAYLTLGGTMTLDELTEVLRGEREISSHEHNLLTQGLNDDFTARGQNHPVPYAEDVAHNDERPLNGTHHR